MNFHLADGNYIGGLTMPKENTNMVGKKMKNLTLKNK